MTKPDWFDMELTQWVWNILLIWNIDNNIENFVENFSENI